MTVLTQTSKSEHIPDFSTNEEFDIAFPFEDAGEIYIWLSLVGVLTQQVNGSDYTVTKYDSVDVNGNYGKAVWVTRILGGSADKVRIQRWSPLVQIRDYRGKEFPIETYEGGLDRLTEYSQQALGRDPEDARHWYADTDRVGNVDTPSGDQDVATKGYVDTAIGGTDAGSVSLGITAADIDKYYKGALPAPLWSTMRELPDHQNKLGYYLHNDGGDNYSWKEVWEVPTTGAATDKLVKAESTGPVWESIDEMANPASEPDYKVLELGSSETVNQWRNAGFMPGAIPIGEGWLASGVNPAGSAWTTEWGGQMVFGVATVELTEGDNGIPSLNSGSHCVQGGSPPSQEVGTDHRVWFGNFLHEMGNTPDSVILTNAMTPSMVSFHPVRNNPDHSWPEWDTAHSGVYDSACPWFTDPDDDSSTVNIPSDIAIEIPNFFHLNVEAVTSSQINITVTSVLHNEGCPPEEIVPPLPFVLTYWLFRAAT